MQTRTQTQTWARAQTHILSRSHTGNKTQTRTRTRAYVPMAATRHARVVWMSCTQRLEHAPCECRCAQSTALFLPLPPGLSGPIPPHTPSISGSWHFVNAKGGVAPCQKAMHTLVVFHQDNRGFLHSGSNNWVSPNKTHNNNN
jgi:hypothetical protein